MQSESKKMSLLLKGALAHPDRREVLGYLLGSAEGTSERELAGALGLSEAKIKYHLTVLRGADLVMQVDDDQGREQSAYIAAGFAGR